MSILIKDMKMPKGIGVLIVGIDSAGKIYSTDSDVGLYETGTETKAVPVPPHMASAIEKVISERRRQMERWGECSDNHPYEWMSILGEEFGELCEATNETCFKRGTHPERGGQDRIIADAAQVAAVAVSIIESAMRQQDKLESTIKQDVPVDTIQNDAYLHSCNCPVCMYPITRGYNEGVAYCETCGQKLHFPPFSKEEIENALFDSEMDSFED